MDRRYYVVSVFDCLQREIFQNFLRVNVNLLNDITHTTFYKMIWYTSMFSVILAKGNTFCDFLFIFCNSESLVELGLLFKKRILSLASTFFPLKVCLHCKVRHK